MAMRSFRSIARENPLDRRRHVRELERIVQMIERGPQEPLRALQIVDPANGEQPCNRRADFQLPRKHRRGLVIASETFPKERNRHHFICLTAKTQGRRAQIRKFLNNTTSLIIDKAIVVHSKLGPGLLESVYRTCLTHELRKAGARVVAEQVVPVFYDELQLDDGYRLDMLVNDAVIVEIKTVERHPAGS